jgi:hypothetical protein
MKTNSKGQLEAISGISRSKGNWLSNGVVLCGLAWRKSRAEMAQSDPKNT